MDNEENEVIDLTEILSAVRQHLLKLIFVTLAAALVGFTASKFLMTPKYDSSALMIVNTRQDVNANVTSDQINSATKLVSTYSIIIKSDTVLQQVIDNLGLNLTYAQLNKRVTVAAVDDTQVMKITVQSDSPEWARQVCEQIITVAPDVIKEVERVLEKKLSSLVNQDYTIVGGVDAIVNILNTVDRTTEKHIMESLEIEEPELADEIRKKMFVFEDILLLDDRAIQRVLRDVDNADLGVALKAANEEVQNVIFKNLSKRLAAMIKEDMEFMGPVRMKDVEEAQQKVVSVIRKLEDSGEIVISRGGGDEIVV